MLSGLKTTRVDSYWPSNLHSLWKVFCKKGATKHSFQVFQHFLHEFQDCIDQDYVVYGLRALACHHSLLLKHDTLWYHTICNANGEYERLTWDRLFLEFRINLRKFVTGSMWLCLRLMVIICYILFVSSDSSPSTN